jgi:hypothetical protein
LQKIYLFGQDISEFVSQIPAVIQSSTDYGQLIINDIPSITGINTRGFWDISNPSSPFYGAPSLTNYKIEIEQDGEITYTGYIQSIQTDNQNRTATVNLQSILQSLLDKKIIYSSATQLTPSQVVADICNLYKIPFDSGSFGAANTIYNNDNIYITANYLNPEVSILDVFQQIAQIAVAAIYSINGILYYDVFYTRTADPIYQFTDDHDDQNGISILSAPVIENVEKAETNGYSVEWAGEPTATFGLETDRGVSISAGADQNIKITSLQAAVWLGELWLEYLNHPQRRITFQTRAVLGKSLSIGYPISIEYRNNQIETIDIFSIDNSSKVFSTLVGLTR